MTEARGTHLPLPGQSETFGKTRSPLGESPASSRSAEHGFARASVLSGPMNPSPDDRTRGRRRVLFAIDLRSLALFRIGLGLLITFDLANRARFLVEHYT